MNLPVPPRSGDEVFVSLVRDVALPLARSYRPQLVLVSAGYDAHEDDPLADCALSDDGYVAMTALLRDLGAELGVPVGCLLEGGYDVGALGTLCRADDANARPRGREPTARPIPAPFPVHPLANEALDRLQPFWAELGR